MTKFELEPYNRNVPDDNLIADLQRVAEKVGKSTITRTEYKNNGRFSSKTIEKRFGTWNKALDVAKINVSHVVDITDVASAEDHQRQIQPLFFTLTTLCHGRKAAKQL